MTKTNAKPTAAPVLPEPAPSVKAAADAATTRQADRPERPEIRSEPDAKGTGFTVAPAHANLTAWSDHLKDAFGTVSHPYTSQALARLERVARDRGEPFAAEAQLNAVLALMGAIAPANELEAAMGEQIVSAHLLSTSMLIKAQHTDTVQKLEAYVGLATKLSRTMATQVEALTKLRSGGKQTHEVRHVYIHGNAYIGDGGQAAFGPMPGGVGNRNPAQSHASAYFPGGAPALGPPVRGEDAPGLSVPIAGRAGPEAMPDARRDQPGCAEGQSERSVSDGAAHGGTEGSSRPCAGSAGECEG